MKVACLSSRKCVTSAAVDSSATGRGVVICLQIPSNKQRQGLSRNGFFFLTFCVPASGAATAQTPRGRATQPFPKLDCFHFVGPDLPVLIIPS